MGSSWGVSLGRVDAVFVRSSRAPPSAMSIVFFFQGLQTSGLESSHRTSFWDPISKCSPIPRSRGVIPSTG